MLGDATFSVDRRPLNTKRTLTPPASAPMGESGAGLIPPFTGTPIGRTQIRDSLAAHAGLSKGPSLAGGFHSGSFGRTTVSF